MRGGADPTTELAEAAATTACGRCHGSDERAVDAPSLRPTAAHLHPPGERGSAGTADEAASERRWRAEVVGESPAAGSRLGRSGFFFIFLFSPVVAGGCSAPLQYILQQRATFACCSRHSIFSGECIAVGGRARRYSSYLPASVEVFWCSVTS